MDYTREDITDHHASFDVILDAAGKLDLRRGRRILAQRGVLLQPVLSARAVADQLRPRISRGPRSVLAFTGLRPDAEKVADLEHLAGLAEAGILRGVVHAELELDAGVEAHRLVEGGGKRGSVVLRP